LTKNVPYIYIYIQWRAKVSGQRHFAFKFIKKKSNQILTFIRYKHKI